MIYASYEQLKKEGQLPSYRAVARAADMDVRHVSRILRGVSMPKLETFRNVARAVGVSMDDLYKIVYGDDTIDATVVGPPVGPTDNCGGCKKGQIPP